MKSDKKPRRMVAGEERAKIDRKVISWLNTCPEKPVQVTTEGQLGTNVPGLGVSTITSAYINRAFIVGGYEAEYQFTLIYRIRPGNSPDRSLQANELLNRIGIWAEQNRPDLGNGIKVRRVDLLSLASTVFKYEDGDEDHHIPIKITYEVM